MVRRARIPSPPVSPGNGHSAPEGGREAARVFAAGLALGDVPSVRRIRREMHVGQPRAQQVRAYLALLAPDPHSDAASAAAAQQGGRSPRNTV